ncbi:MAG: N5-glutamine S-adenosyl-L-methionine-dependent methyltransferase [Bacteroidetes bacterium ADurb.Bin408]|nr:MAG: N5-glutamine S-adenosyl-L-methionine-dependent methyltransferase [Bacteroidetes bacterium ADurb.Bin408]
MHANVLAFEPHTALFVPDDDALLFYAAIIAFAKNHLKKGGALYVEINESLGDAVRKLFEDAGYQQVATRKDLQGKDRMVKVSLL